MLAKLIASAATREAAIARAAAALRAFPVLGVRTNIPFLIKVLEHPAFQAGDIHTGFIDAHLDELLRAAEPSDAIRAAAAFARANRTATTASSGSAAAVADPWTDLRGWGR
jgi:acetyl/propionyl-CoA carboxylase alpha subunit